LLCIHYDNSPEHGRYFDNKDDDDITDIASKIEDSVDYSDLLHVEALDRTDEEYSPGDAVPTRIDTWNQYDYRWPMPSADAYGNCNDMNNARFMESADFPPCSRTESPADICSTSLSSKSYISDLQIATNPRADTTVAVELRNVYRRSSSTYDTDTLSNLP